jgi:phage baseplate assembly protein W
MGGLDHIRQSIGDILSTRLGERVMVPEYGSEVPDVIDAPMNSGAAVDAFMAVAEALGKWEPRFALEKIEATRAEQEGSAGFVLTGRVTPDEQVRLEVHI